MLVALAILPLIAGCHSVGGFNYPYDIPEQRVMGSAVGALLPANVFSIPLDIDLSSATASHGTGPAQHVYLTDLTFAITPTSQPPGQMDDFSFLSSIEIYVESTVSGSSLPRVRIAHLDSIPPGARTIALQTDGVDLIRYVREGARLTANGRGHLPPRDTTFVGHLDVAIEVL